MLIRSDAQGLYIRDRMGGSNHYRPGDCVGYAPIYRMDAHTLKEGDSPKAHHVAGAPLVKITCPDGVVLHWADTEAHAIYGPRR